MDIMTQIHAVDLQLLYEALYIVLRIMVTCGGGMVASHFVLKYMTPFLERGSRKMGVNIYSVINKAAAGVLAVVLALILTKSGPDPEGAI